MGGCSHLSPFPLLLGFLTKMDSPLLSTVIFFFFKEVERRRKRKWTKSISVGGEFHIFEAQVYCLIKWKYGPIVSKTLEDNSNTDTGPPNATTLSFNLEHLWQPGQAVTKTGGWQWPIVNTYLHSNYPPKKPNNYMPTTLYLSIRSENYLV